MIKKIKDLEKVAAHLDPLQTQRDEWNTEVMQYADAFINGLILYKLKFSLKLMQRIHMILTLLRVQQIKSSFSKN